MSFKEAEQKMRDKRILKDVIEDTDYVHLSDALAVLGDLHHAWCESQKTLKELLEDRPNIFEVEDTIEKVPKKVMVIYITLAEKWFEKAEKLLETASK